MLNRDKFLSELEAMGEPEVRLRMRQNVFGASKLPVVLEFLERARETKASSSEEESRALSKDANAASWAAARAAQRANTIAMAAAILAIVSIVISILALIAGC